MILNLKRIATSLILSSSLLHSVYAKEIPFQSSSVSTVKLTSTEWCPFICPHTLRNKGLILDISILSFKEMGINVEYTHSRSWKKAILNVQDGSQDVLLDAGQEHTKTLDFSENFYVEERAMFMTINKHNITLNYPSDLNNYKIGIVEGYVYDESLGNWEKAITYHENTVKINDTLGEAHLLKMLSRKRIDIAVMNWDVAKYSMTESNQKNFKAIDKDVLSKIHLGFTRSKRGEVLKRKFQEGFNRLIGTQTLKDIYAKYQIQMPEFTISDD